MSGKAMMKKKVLIVAKYFPPAGGVGTIRVTKFVKYLREYGWEPVVLTVRQNCYSEKAWLDHSLMKDIPENISIYRTSTWHTRVINDEGIRWLPYLLTSICKVIMKEKPQVVYLTGGPFFPLIVGPIIKLLFQLPYVIDLRDPWKLARKAHPNRSLKAKLGQLLTNIIEPIVIHHASKVVCATKGLQEAYQSAYRKQSAKFLTITNGYDPDDFNNVLPKEYREFTIVYTGKFRRSEAFHDPTPVFQAMRILKQEGIQIRLIHVGAKEQEVMMLAAQMGIENEVEFVGAKSHVEALSYAMGADLLLVIGSNRKMGLPVKMFDYIGCHRPILALGYEGEEMLDTAREISAITLFVSEGPEAIAEAIKKVFSNKLRINQEKNLIERYTREYLAGVLAEAFDSVSATME